jgi:putative ABC transport system permease protein
MIWLRMAIANLLSAPLTATVNALLLALGTASIVVLLLAAEQFGSAMARDARGIDLVIGAKGSPFQLVLAAVYHADAPPGNIPRADAERWAADARVRSAVPLSLGDSYRGFRIVGTTPGYADLYHATLHEGRFWQAPMEAVVGAVVAREAGLPVGARFAGAHGLVGGSHVHESRPFRVVGALAPTGTVIDRLILTSLDSVWALHHEAHEHESEERLEQAHAHSHEHAHGEPVAADEAGPGPEITAMLLAYRTPLATLTLPREINVQTSLQAASPAFEVARLLQLVGIGLDGLRAFSGILVAAAALSIFAALYGSLRARRYDLAMLRCLGATRAELFFGLLLEGLLLTAAGVALGFLAGHAAVELLGQWLEDSRGIMVTGWAWASGELPLLLGLIGVGALAAAIPAWQAYRTDVARTLAQG